MKEYQPGLNLDVDTIGRVAVPLNGNGHMDTALIEQREKVAPENIIFITPKRKEPCCFYTGGKHEVVVIGIPKIGNQIRIAHAKEGGSFLHADLKALAAPSSETYSEVKAWIRPLPQAYRNQKQQAVLQLVCEQEDEIETLRELNLPYLDPRDLSNSTLGSICAAVKASKWEFIVNTEKKVSIARGFMTRAQHTIASGKSTITKYRTREGD